MVYLFLVSFSALFLTMTIDQLICLISHLDTVLSPTTLYWWMWLAIRLWRHCPLTHMDVTGYQVVAKLSSHPRHCTDGCDWQSGCDDTVMSSHPHGCDRLSGCDDTVLSPTTLYWWMWLAISGCDDTVLSPTTCTCMDVTGYQVVTSSWPTEQ